MKCKQCKRQLHELYWVIKLELEPDSGNYPDEFGFSNPKSYVRPEQAFCSIKCIRDWAIEAGKIFNFD